MLSLVVAECLVCVLKHSGQPLGADEHTPAMELGGGESPHELEARQRYLMLPEAADRIEYAVPSR